MRTVHKRRGLLLLLAFIAFFIIPCHVGAEKEIAPVTNSGKKWRIGYFQSGEYYEFREQLIGLVLSLKDIGWIKKAEIPTDETIRNDTEKLWLWLSENIESDYLEFAGDAFWNAFWDSCDVNEDIYERAEKKKYVDLILAMGTVAGQCLTKKMNKEYSVNTMVLCASDPVQSGIVDDFEYSGKNHIHAEVHDKMFFREIKLFHRFVKFKRLGIVYHDTSEGRIYAAVEDARRAAKEGQFELIEKKIESTEDYSNQQLITMYKDLAKQVDAMYITEHLEENKKNTALLKELLKKMFEYKVATWSQTPRSWMVKYGVLMSIKEADVADVAMFNAKVMAQILRGNKPGEIEQIFVNPKSGSVTLNLETAQKIQLDLSWNVLATAEYVYETIENNNTR
jgi:ABC-type uncharacterized transport system substrate-binding protein